MLQNYLAYIVRHRSWVIVVTLLVSAFWATRIGHLQVVVDTSQNLPQDHPYVSATKEIEQLFGGRNLVVIGVESVSGDIYQPEMLARVMRITDGVLQIPGVIRSNVISVSARKAKDIKGTGDGMLIRPLLETIPRTADDLARLKRAIADNPIYIDSIVSKDGRMALVIADFTLGPDLPGYRAIKDRVEAVIDRERDPSVNVYLGGISINLAWLEIYSQRMAYYFFVSLAVIMGVLYLSFRSIQGMAIPIVTALLSVVWGLGVMGLLEVPMDAFNVTTPILIMAVAAGHSVQILKRYYEEFARLGDSSAAVVASLTKIGPVMLTAGSIATVSFLTLMVFPTATIRIFGLFTATGILAAMILELTFIPAIRSALPPPSRFEAEREGTRGYVDRLTDTLADLVTAGRWRQLTSAGVVLLLVLLMGIQRLEVDNSIKGSFAEDSLVRLDDNALNAAMGGSNTLYLLVEGPAPDAIKNPAVLKAMEAVQRYLETRHELVGKTQSVVDFLQKMNRALHEDDPAYDRLPEDRDLIAQSLLLYSMSGDPGDLDSYVDYEYRSGVIWAYLKTDSTAYYERVIADLRPFLQAQFPPDYRLVIGGGMAQGAALNEVMVRGKLLNIGAIAVSIYTISSLVFRSALAGLYVLIPLALTVIANFGVMGLTGIRLDIGTSTVSAMAVGVGADYAIYIIYRLREEMGLHGDPEQAVRTTLTTAGKAVTYVALAVGLGYAVLMLTGFGLHTRLGFLVAVAMAVSCLAAILLVPALAFRFRPGFIFSLPSKRTEPAYETSTL
jgi:predicted RND superfamily exporter protein